jgi:hypothetical protein
MELSNALAQFWRHLNDRAIRQGHAEEGERAAEIGQHILDLIRSWHLEAAKEYEEKERRPLNLQRSVFLTISYFRVGLFGRTGQRTAFAGLIRRCQVRRFSIGIGSPVDN